MAMAGDSKPHIVVLPFFAQGHIPPMVHLARKLAAHGFIVTIVNIDSVHKELQKRWNCPPELDIRLEGVECSINLPNGVDGECIRQQKDTPGSLAIDFLSVESGVERLVQGLLPFPCCLIADFFYGWAARLAKEMKMKAVVYWPGNAAWSALHHYLDMLVSNGDAYSEEEKSGEVVISYVPGVDPFKYEDLPEYFSSHHANDGSGEFFHGSKNRMRDSEWTLVNSMVELEPQTFEVMLENKNFVSVGPLFPLTPDVNDRTSAGCLREEDTKCLEWLNTRGKKSVLYIAFGSIANMSETAFEEFVAGLEASEQPFLWVIRSDMLDKTASVQERYKAFVERVHEQQGYVVSWAPQLRVLSDGSVGGFLSHCGWNSTFESLCKGVPMLCWPVLSEQRLNSKMVVEDWRFGACFSKDLEVERTQVEEKIRGFMSEADDIRSRMKAFVGMARETVCEGGVSHRNLQAFMQAMKSA